MLRISSFHCLPLRHTAQGQIVALYSFGRECPILFFFFNCLKIDSVWGLLWMPQQTILFLSGSGRKGVFAVCQFIQITWIPFFSYCWLCLADAKTLKRTDFLWLNEMKGFCAPTISLGYFSSWFSFEEWSLFYHHCVRVSFILKFPS